MSNDFWDDVFDDTTEKDLFLEYIRLYETEKEKAFCFIYQDQENTFLFPYLRRICKIEDDIEYYDVDLDLIELVHKRYGKIRFYGSDWLLPKDTSHAHE